MCLCIYVAKMQYWRINVLFHSSVYFIALVLRPRIAFLKCIVTRHTQTHAHTHKTHLGKHSSREVINQFYVFLWESFLLSNQASSLLPPSFPPLWFSFLYFHLYQFCLTSENDPLHQINFSYFSYFTEGIARSLPGWRDKTTATELRLRPSIYLPVLINLKEENLCSVKKREKKRHP